MAFADGGVTGQHTQFFKHPGWRGGLERPRGQGKVSVLKAKDVSQTSFSQPPRNTEIKVGDELKVLELQLLPMRIWWVVKCFEYHPGEQLKNLSQYNAPGSHYQLSKISSLDKIYLPFMD